MKLFIIRHGQSIGNANCTHQSPHDPLSPLGIEQSEHLAKRFMQKNNTFASAQVILSSPYERAEHTASIIHEKTKIPLQILDILHETKKPSEIVGQKADKPDVVTIKKQIKENRHLPNFRYSDEETFFEIKQRAVQVLQELISLNKIQMIVVTHEDFLKMILAVMIFGDSADLFMFEKLEQFFKFVNAGISVFEYSEPATSWHIISLNDLSHLPENLIT